MLEFIMFGIWFVIVFFIFMITEGDAKATIAFTALVSLFFWLVYCAILDDRENMKECMQYHKKYECVSMLQRDLD